MDEFTKRHLRQYAMMCCFDDERLAFIEYATQAIDDDPDLVVVGWPTLLASFRKVSV